MSRLIILSLFVVVCNSWCIGQDRSFEDFLKIDSAFTHYFFTLDAYVAKKNRDYPGERSTIIGHLERLTEISADGDGNFIGKFDFSFKNLLDWKEWYANNQEKLIWNERLKTIERRPLEQAAQYKFGKAVNSMIDSVLVRKSNTDSTYQFYFFLTRSEGQDNYKLFIESYTGKPSDNAGAIISLSSRFYVYNQVKIPICLDSDLDFITNYGKTYGVILRTTLKNSHSFVEFSRNGKVTRLGE